MIEAFQGPASGLLHITALIGLGAAATAVMACAFYGWGRLIRNLTTLPPGTWPVSIALGLAGIIFLGGVLNLCRAATPPAFAVLVLVGLVLSVLALRRDLAQAQKHPRHWRGAALWGIGVAALMGFVIATQSAPLHYNPYDDFQYYFLHAVRMAQTGTLYGSPLNALGGEGLGGQTVLQGFICGLFPLAYLNAADAVFCFFLCLALAGSTAFARPQLWPVAIAGTVAVFVIDPLYVNISSLYSTAAMVAALAILSTDARETSGAAGWRRAAAPALFYAALVALKNTGLVFAGLQFVFVMAACGWASGNWRASLLQAGRIAVWSAVFLAPWLALYAPYYLAALIHPIGPSSMPVPPVSEPRGLLFLFSPAMSFYGASLLAYTGLALALLLCALHCAWRARTDNRDQLMILAATAAAAALSYFFWIVWGPRLQELRNTVRYAAPFLIGACCVVLPLWAAATARRGTLRYAVLTLLPLLLFVPSLHLRIGKLLHQRSQLAFLHHWRGSQIERSRASTALAFHGLLREDMRRLQANIPAGEPFLAWTMTSFLLDYRRNPVIDMNMAGASQAWGRIPRTRYILWQHGGYAAPKEDELVHEIVTYGRRVGEADARGLDVLHYLQAIPTAQIRDNRADMFLIRLDDGAPPPN